MKNQNQQPTPTSHEQTEAKAEVIKLGVDVYAKKYVAVSQTDNETMRSPRSFSPEDFLVWAEQLKKQTKRIVVCYEAGCFGYVLYRDLVKTGIECLVVAPRKWDQGVKTDARDARELCSNLDRYLNGNRKALTVVHRPMPGRGQQWWKTTTGQCDEARQLGDPPLFAGGDMEDVQLSIRL